MPEDSNRSEHRVDDLRRELDRLWHTRYSAEMTGDDRELWKARFDLAETTLEKCSAIADYVRTVSDSTANEIEEKVKMVTQDLRDKRKTGDLESLHDWYKTELAPLLNKVEQESHLVSEMKSKKQQQQQRASSPPSSAAG